MKTISYEWRTDIENLPNDQQVLFAWRFTFPDYWDMDPDDVLYSLGYKDDDMYRLEGFKHRQRERDIEVLAYKYIEPYGGLK